MENNELVDRIVRGLNYNEIVPTAKSHQGCPKEADEKELVHVESCR